MTFSRSAGSTKSPPPTLKVQRRIDVDDNGNEILGTEGFWLVDGAGNVLRGRFSSAEEASIARRAYLTELGHGA